MIRPREDIQLMELSDEEEDSDYDDHSANEKVRYVPRLQTDVATQMPTVRGMKRQLEDRSLVVFDRKRVGVCMRHIVPCWLLVDELLRAQVPFEVVRLIGCLFYRLDDRIVDVCGTRDPTLMRINLNEPMLWIALDVVAACPKLRPVERLQLDLLYDGDEVSRDIFEVLAEEFKPPLEHRLMRAISQEGYNADTIRWSDLFDEDMHDLDKQEKMCSSCVRDIVADVDCIHAWTEEDDYYFIGQ
jgi:hypothetical protein